MSDKVDFPVLPMTGDEEVDIYRQHLNWMAESVAVTHARVERMFNVFSQLEPLMGTLPKMPPGMMPPAGLMPPMGIMRK